MVVKMERFLQIVAHQMPSRLGPGCQPAALTEEPGPSLRTEHKVGH